jgi:ribosomal protein L11 methyltransferase
MGNYIKIAFENISAEQREIMIALLAEKGFDGFEEFDDAMFAFIAEEKFDEAVLLQFETGEPLTYQKSIITETNWNKLWESGFNPVTIGDFAGIRAGFHQPLNNVQHEIIITPKMSFGTGHHATTYMMIETMRDIDFKNKSVLDFGTGTGILAILANKLGARKVTAIDCDEWSIENAAENFKHNFCKNIDLIRSDRLALHERFDIILANINKHVLLQSAEAIKSALAPSGTLVISGVLLQDKADMTEAFDIPVSVKEKNNWLCLAFKVV